MAKEYNNDDKILNDRPVATPTLPGFLPTESTDNTHTAPLTHDEDMEKPDPALPPEPGHDINP